MSRLFTKLNIVFAVQFLAVLFAVLGTIPREVFLFSGSILFFFVLFSSMEDSVLLIARSIPIFVALPLSETFDSLNMWRIVVLMIFLKWFFADGRLGRFRDAITNIVLRTKKSIRNGWAFAWNEWRMETLVTLLFLISTLSLIHAGDIGLGIKRIVFFANLWALFFVVRSVTNSGNLKKIAWNVAISGCIVVGVGMAQLVSAYVMHIDQFAEFWALQADKALYGTAWANIAINANTWFAYYNGTIHLRMFSSFPDTHSLPLYLLMAVCFAMILRERAFTLLLIALAMAETVLSGTRGIWVSILMPLAFLGYLWFKKYSFPKMVFMPLVLFFVFLPLSGFIFGSTQFKLAETGAERSVLTERIKSIVDIGETSNEGRIFIWKETLRSMAKHPLLGVGIGNFPVILKLNPTAIKAGASAHNLYLNFFAELGVFGFIVFMCIVYEMWKAGWKLFTQKDDARVSFLGLNFLIYFLWIAAYSMTDVAIFDERAFLLFMILTGAVFALKGLKTKSPASV